MISRSSLAVLRCTFLLTGAGTALLGATLPATLLHHHLTDSAGGTLLLAGWGGSTSGAFFARGRLAYGAALGCVLSAAALFSMASHLLPPMLDLAYLLYGTGLGLTMTDISLLRSRQAGADQVSPELNKLNLLWALGACVAPILAVRSLQERSVATLYHAVGAIFLCAAAALWLTSRQSEKEDTSPQLTLTRSPTTWAPWRFSLFAATSVGLESAVGSWLTTYSQRTTSDISTASSANLTFWLGLLASRALHSSSSLPSLQTRPARVLHLLLILIGVVLLLLRPDSHTLPLAGGLCGFGLGPLYPYVLSATLPRYRSTVVFMLAGVGASAVPFLTGLLSTETGSLQKGMLVPATTLALLVYSYAAIVVHKQAD